MVQINLDVLARDAATANRLRSASWSK